MFYTSFKRDLAVAQIPKAGLTSIMQWLGRDFPVMSNDEARKVSRRVAFIRHPLERLKSCYSFMYWLRDTALVRDGTNVGQRMYLSSGGEYVFRYQDVGSDEDQSPAWDLNNLIGFSYAWYANRIKATDPTEAQELMETADELFIGAALNGYFYGAKQYNELMRLSFKYVAIHDASGLGYCTS